jgi:hypothetical protein
MIRLINKPDIEAPSLDYPFGSIQDDSAGIDGTPLNRLVHSDQHQFFEKLIEDGEVTANNLPDNSLNGYQLNEALDNVIAFRDIDLIQSFNQNTNPLEVWQFFYKNIINTTGNSNLPATVSSTWTWEGGSVIYNYKVYNSSNGTTTLNIGEFLVYYIIDNKTIGIRKNNDGAYLQAVDIFKYMNLETSGTNLAGGGLDWKLTKRGNIWNFVFDVNNNDTFFASNQLFFKNYRGLNRIATGSVCTFFFHNTSGTNNILKCFLTKVGNDLYIKLDPSTPGAGGNSGTGQVSWIE